MIGACEALSDKLFALKGICMKTSGRYPNFVLLLLFTLLIVNVESVIAESPAQDPALPEGMEFISIPTGDFMMGSPTSESDRYHDEESHSVSIDSFELMATEVTQRMWEEVMGVSIEYQFSSANDDYGLAGTGDDYPIYYVSWNDCQEFISELNSIDPDHTYRLPTEAEWEYACRAGSRTAFYWGNSDSDSTMNEYCWYAVNSDSEAHPVGILQPNDWGLYDMSGNVWEWCEDNYAEDYADCPTDGSAHEGPETRRILRGGGWFFYPSYCRSAYRNLDSPDYANSNIGFRLARSAS